MKTWQFKVPAIGRVLLSWLLLSTGVAEGQRVPFAVSFWYPTNGEMFLAPATVGVHALVTDSNVVRTMQYFANGSSLGTVSNTSGELLTNSTQENPFFLSWSNVPAGSYTLTAVAHDSAANQATSAPVTITVTNPMVHPSVYIFSPTNAAKFTGPTNLTLYARAVESGGTVAEVQFFANNASLGVVSNSSQAVFTNVSSEPLFPLAWSNVLAGSYALTAVATDTFGNATTSSVVSISVITNVPPRPLPFVVGFLYPTNGEAFLAPATVWLHASVSDSNVVRTVQFFENGNSLGLVTNSGSVLLTNLSVESPLYLGWSNVLAGTYALTAVALDSAGATATSAPVTISVTNASPPVIRPSVAIYSPTNGSVYLTPAAMTIYARAVESTGAVATVQFFANSTSLGVVSNSSQAIYANISTEPLFALGWSNVTAGSYSLKAVATDTFGNAATSSVVSLSVITNRPPPPPPPTVPYLVSFWYPTNGELFLAPATIGVHALVTDSNVVRSVQYFANGGSLGIVSNSSGTLFTNSTESNPFFLEWSNVPAGSYALTALALDSTGSAATSAPVNILVVTSLPPVISICATDPVAVEGTNPASWYFPNSCASNYVCGGNTATFLVHRSSGTNASLTVDYAVGGTAIEGVDYEALPGSVTIAAGMSYALIPIIPLSDTNSTYSNYDTVTLALVRPPAAVAVPPPYLVGSPSEAGAIILEEKNLPIPQPLIRSMADSSLHVSLPATNGMNFSLEVSTDMVNWQPAFTNTVLKGSAQFVDPTGMAGAGFYYRIVPVATPASY